MPLPRLISEGVFGYFPWRGTTGTAPTEYVDDTVSELLHAETAEQRLAILTADSVEVDYFCEWFAFDESVGYGRISDEIFGGEVEHHAYNTIHGTFRFQTTKELDWGQDVIQPWMLLTGGGYWESFALGRFLTTTPEVDLSTDPVTYDVTCVDKLSLLSRPIGDSYFVATGTVYLTAVAAALTAAGLTGTQGVLQLDSSALASTLAAPMVWILDDTETTWLRVINDLLTAVNYRGLYCDQAGSFISEPYVAPSTKPSAFDFDLANIRTNIVAENRKYSKDEYNRTNWRRFVKTGLTAAPVETASPPNTTDTQYTQDDSVTTKYKKVYYLDVVDGDALYAEAQRIINTETQHKKVIEISAGSVPSLWHFDAVTFRDIATGTGSMKCQVTDWVLPLSGEDMSITLEVVE
jgi:hypothetical protein